MLEAEYGDVTYEVEIHFKSVVSEAYVMVSILELVGRAIASGSFVHIPTNPIWPRMCEPKDTYMEALGISAWHPMAKVWQINV